MKIKIITLLSFLEYSCLHECCFLVRFSWIFDMKVIDHLLSVHKFVIISIISVEIVVIVLSFDLILKSSLILSRVQYIVNFLFIFIVYHYWSREFILLIRQRIINDETKKLWMKYIMYMHSLKSFQFIEWVNKINDLKRVEHLVIQFENDKWWTIKEKCSVVCKETFIV